MPDGGGWDYRDDLRRSAELKKREDDLRAAGFTKRITMGGGGRSGDGGGEEGWFHTGKKLGAGAIGADRTMVSAAKPVSRPLGVAAEKWGAPIRSATKPKKSKPIKEKGIETGMGSVKRPGFTTGSDADPAHGGSGYTTGGDPGGARTTTTDSVVKSPVQPMQLATLTDEMDLSNKLKEIIDTNSPLFKAAQTKALQAMQSRGLVNSSLAQEAVMQSILNVALPIAQQEVQSLQQNLYYNTDWANKDKQQANEFYQNKILTRLQGKINFQLQEMVQSYAAWGKYGDWITQIITTQGADQDAWKRMLDAIKAAGGWPQIGGFGDGTV